MSVSVPAGPPPNQTEPRKEWRDWFQSMWLSVSGLAADSFYSLLRRHTEDFNNPHSTTWAQVVTSESTLQSIQDKRHELLDGAGSFTHADIDVHLGSAANPHTTTVDQVYAAGGPTFITNRDPLRYALMMGGPN